LKSSFGGFVISGISNNNESINKQIVESFSNRNDLKRKYVDEDLFHKNKIKKTDVDKICNLKDKNIESHVLSISAENQIICNEVKDQVEKKEEDLQGNSLIFTKYNDWNSKLVEINNIFRRHLLQRIPMTKQIGNINNVFAIPSEKDSSKIIGYYKEGSVGKESLGKAVSTMEKLIWDIAVILGFKNSFAPTETIKLNSKQEGSIQVAHQGISLFDYLGEKNIPKNQKPISQNELIIATLITLIFGMFDAHGGNIIVDEDGHLLFFDNTRSLPNSNNFINRMALGPIPAYRSSLLALSGSYQTLTSEELEQIKDEILKQQQKMTDVCKFLESQKQPLPPRWLEVEAFHAMEQRLENMQQALNDLKIHCLRDLVFGAMPYLKFPSILQLLMSDHKMPEMQSTNDELIKEIQQYSLIKLGFHPMEKLLTNCVEKGLDPQEIKKWCEEDPNLTFEEVICKTSDQVNKSRKISEEIKKELIVSKNKIINDLVCSYSLDGKDDDIIDRLQKKTERMIAEILQVNRQEFIVSSQDENIKEYCEEYLTSTGKYFVVTDSKKKPTACWLLHKKNNEFVYQKIRCTLSSSWVELEGHSDATHIKHLETTLASIESNKEGN
jgi:hypothetical protein